MRVFSHVGVIQYNFHFTQKPSKFSRVFSLELLLKKLILDTLAELYGNSNLFPWIVFFFSILCLKVFPFHTKSFHKKFYLIFLFLNYFPLFGVFLKMKFPWWNWWKVGIGKVQSGILKKNSEIDLNLKIWYKIAISM